MQGKQAKKCSLYMINEHFNLFLPAATDSSAVKTLPRCGALLRKLFNGNQS